MLNQFLSHTVIQLISKDPGYTHCCKRLSALYRQDQQLAVNLIKSALNDALHINDILPYVLSDLETIENDRIN
jgi:hypothetical protein